MQILTYGADSTQFVQWFEPICSKDQVKGTIVLVHGGFWRKSYDLHLMDPLVDYFLQNDWAVANVEYRRADCGGDWPTILHDVEAAVACAKDQALQQGYAHRVISVGHSVGGQLVLLTAQLMDAVVALAPVTDVIRAYNDHLGENAAQAFFQRSPAKAPECFLSASPIAQLPLQTRTLVVHGSVDERVPVEYARDYCRQAVFMGDEISYWEERLTHREVIDPNQPFWDRVQLWLLQ